jgi:hypothetical protein
MGAGTSLNRSINSVKPTSPLPSPANTVRSTHQRGREGVTRKKSLSFIGRLFKRRKASHSVRTAQSARSSRIIIDDDVSVVTAAGAGERQQAEEFEQAYGEAITPDSHNDAEDDAYGDEDEDEGDSDYDGYYRDAASPVYPRRVPGLTLTATASHRILPPVHKHSSGAAWKVVGATPAMTDCVNVTPRTPVSAARYQYYCPLCMCHYAETLVNTCCNNNTCYGCSVAYLKSLGSILSTEKSVPFDVPGWVRCPHCTQSFTPSLVFKRADGERRARRYVDEKIDPADDEGADLVADLVAEDSIYKNMLLDAVVTTDAFETSCWPGGDSDDDNDNDSSTGNTLTTARDDLELQSCSSTASSPERSAVAAAVANRFVRGGIDGVLRSLD